MSENNRPVRRPEGAGQGDPARRPVGTGQERAARRPAGVGPGDPARRAANVQRPAGRPAAPQAEQTGRRLPGGFVPLVIVCALILALGAVLQGLMPNGFVLATGNNDKAERPVAAQVSEIHGEGPIRLNEIMSANGGVLVDAAGATPDWVEVANIGSRPVNLRGYVLAKSAKAGNVFMFPDVILQPGECALVYADSTLKAELGEELHAPFRLSSGGDVLMLFNDADVAVDTVNLPELGENIAYVREDRNTWRASEQVTPGLLNTEENYRAMTSVAQGSPVQLSEIVASNTKYRPDESGVFHDYVVLRNTSGDAVDIGGWYLSDKPRLPRLWRFPEGTVIPGGGALTVYCSGLNRIEDPARLHTGFKLSTEGETLTLSNANGQPVDTVSYDLLHADQALLRGGDGSWSVGEPTQ